MTFVENITSLFSKITSVLSSFGIADALDIILVAFIIYQSIKLIRETRAFQLAKGLLLLAIVYFVITNIIDMQATAYIFSKVFSNVILVLIILFVPELRHAIEHMGRSWSSTLSFFGLGEKKAVSEDKLRTNIIEISKACSRMSVSKTGSLIIIENNTLLGDIIKTGTITDAAISHEIIGNMFFPNSPLHDGAVIIRGERLYAAGCVLPLTQNPEIPSDLGMRHRAALGVTEQSDAVAIITSEETGTISVCYKGSIERGFNEASLRERLFEFFLSDTNDSPKNFGETIKKFIEGLGKNEK